ncbi:ribosomal protein L24e-domain-containing protein [Zopfochytrium polystomum]|nr:ribosomal protein L24e-domain-containing protein [Zopfochytrium polystomum]
MATDYFDLGSSSIRIVPTSVSAVDIQRWDAIPICTLAGNQTISTTGGSDYLVLSWTNLASIRISPPNSHRRTEICQFSGYKIYPGHGKLLIRVDSRSFRIINGKCESYFLQRLKPSKLDWTVVFRRLHKKDKTEEVTKKRSRRTVKAQRAVVGASLDAIKAKKNQKPELRATLRQKAISEAKEKKKEAEKKKKEAKAKVAPKSQPKISKQQAKGAAPKVQAKSR